MLKIFKKRDNLQYEFLPAALEISETPPSPLGRTVIWLIFSVLVIAILWAYWGRVDEVAVAAGRVIPDGRLKVVQPLEEGVITAIHVSEGQRVKEGQVLIELDSTMKNVEVQSIEKALETARLERDLLKKALQGEDIQKLVEESMLPDEVKNNLSSLTQLRDTQYSTEQKSLSLLVLQYEDQYDIEQSNVKRLEENLKLLQAKEQNLKALIETGGVEAANLKRVGKNILILEEEEKTCKELYDAGAIAKKEWQDKLNELELAKKDYETQKAAVSREKSTLELNWKSAYDDIKLMEKQLDVQKITAEQAENKLKEAKVELEKVENQRGVSSMDLVVENDKKITSLEGELEKAEKSKQYQTLNSPVAGTVHGLAQNTIGGVVTPAEPVLTIVPDGTPLIIEASLLNKDIGFVEVNQETAVKFDTFSFQKYGTIKGRVVYISPDSVDDERMGAVYKMKVSLEKNTIDIEGKENNICSGMSVNVEIKTGERRILEFFLDPIVKYTKDSIKLR
ncbi:HlyD family type I secretion membrane fusion protein [Ruminiclostridium sufflavum DSM 19573]|uniref:HlyD family type I secretion membrane fusion protein n=1 Tax=Ruminiclostridium sufflavum DSM 19573 TaxID=1121337 RepID=A0A318XGH6_9FIRM|nr:HlyD family type I secretion periplasmic adaptor subunit [Ruminiclostridium sufflavum]PYG85630.1 HlyD family type I secretion membrane fusion protein [Ruminiclostridium sufflavum DSM 19573]